MSEGIEVRVRGGERVRDEIGRGDSREATGNQRGWGNGLDWIAAGRRWGGNYSKIRLDYRIWGWKSVREALHAR
jgi:hypothetical protein